MLDPSTLRPGLPVRVTKLGTTDGLLIVPERLSLRRTGRGELIRTVDGHGGDVWWVKHPDDTVSAYSVSEMELG